MSASTQFVSFMLGSEEFGVPIGVVQEINRMVGVTRLPGAPSFVEGVINLRGQLIPIIDLRSRFGMKKCEPTAQTRIIVCDAHGARIGMVVDCVSEVLQIDAGNVEAAPQMSASVDTSYIAGVGKHGDRLIILLNLSNINYREVAAA